MTEGYRDYAYAGGEHSDSHAYLLPAVLRLLQGIRPAQRRIFELGCGNGSVAAVLDREGYEVQGIEYSESAVRMARAHHPRLRVDEGSVYDDLAGRYGQFPLALSLEVVEHLYFPRRFATVLHELLEPEGHAIVSTPYHGYWKNLALALSGRMDSHFTALWDGGHIKFWSIATLRKLFEEAGLELVRVERVGRIPPLAKSMVLLLRKPVTAV